MLLRLRPVSRHHPSILRHLQLLHQRTNSDETDLASLEVMVSYTPARVRNVAKGLRPYRNAISACEYRADQAMVLGPWWLDLSRCWVSGRAVGVGFFECIAEWLNI
jgi:hypothetical protein